MARGALSEITAVEAPLFRAATRERSLDEAWRHVRERAGESPDEATRREWGLIEQDPKLYLRRLQRKLGSGEFNFEAQRAVLKRRRDKLPRPIVVAPLRNRIVHRAILAVIQDCRPAVAKHLGAIPERLMIETSVGGLPGRGARDAIRLIRDAIAQGATHYVRSDIRDFFVNIPRERLNRVFHENVGDERFLDLLIAGLKVDLANADSEDVREHWGLFPSDAQGVPQGSSLSAFSANLLMSDFDREMNGRGVVTIRYLDDILILASTAHAASCAWRSAKQKLEQLGLEAHEPKSGSSKATKGVIASGFDFLSFHITDQSICPSAPARSKLLLEVEATLNERIAELSRNAGARRRATDGFVQTLARIDRRVRGWGDAFQDTDQRLIFAQMDERVDQILSRSIATFFRSLQGVSRIHSRRMWGVALLQDTKVSEPPSSGVGDHDNRLKPRRGSGTARLVASEQA